MQDVSAEAIACMVDMSPDDVQDVLGSTARSASGSQQAIMQLAQNASDTLMQLQAGLSSSGTAEEHGGHHCSPDAALGVFPAFHPACNVQSLQRRLCQLA